eukprot:m.141322 g.141322  ORF g.141322 m.141322 type:complete len:118 (-) comp17669_c0_seq4:148-501(-)
MRVFVDESRLFWERLCAVECICSCRCGLLGVQAWFKDNHVSVKQRQQPWYAVLVDSGDRDEAYSRTYVMEENIQIVSDQAEVQAFHHSDTSDYFVGYDAHMQRWEPTERLRRRYPED